jgi:hypothetical protein
MFDQIMKMAVRKDVEEKQNAAMRKRCACPWCPDDVVEGCCELEGRPTCERHNLAGAPVNPTESRNP